MSATVLRKALFPEAWLAKLRERTPMGPLVGQRVKLVRSGSTWKGLCPFQRA